MPHVPAQRSPRSKSPRTLLVLGHERAAAEAVRCVAQVGRETWAVVGRGPGRWALTVGRRT